MNTKDILIGNFTDERFQKAFKLYFSELGVNVTKWDALFSEMNHDPHGKNLAYVRLEEDHVVGFIQFAGMKMTSWFFESELGFIREFWIAEKYRGLGHGTALLKKAENDLSENGIQFSILTTDTAPDFYTKNGYRYMKSIGALNKMPVFMKKLF